MRYIDINQVLAQIPEEVKTALNDKHKLLVDGNDQAKNDIIDNGNTTWRRVKTILEEASNRKCWYTESKNPGCLNDVDHFRPKARNENNGVIQHWYWFLAFDPENYRLSCQFSNRLNTNPDSGLTGGKGNRFPLMDGQTHATTKDGITAESAVLLDPCKQSDCDLLEFLPDGRPVVSTNHRGNPDDCYRVEQTNLILNLDFPTFNEDREGLYNKIKNLVELGNMCISDGPVIEYAKNQLRELMLQSSPYSKAAECYIRCFREHEWIEDLLI